VKRWLPVVIRGLKFVTLLGSGHATVVLALTIVCVILRTPNVVLDMRVIGVTKREEGDITHAITRTREIPFFLAAVVMIVALMRKQHVLVCV
jgi:hypothetical protein